MTHSSNESGKRIFVFGFWTIISIMVQFAMTGNAFMTFTCALFTALTSHMLIRVLKRRSDPLKKTKESS